MRKINTAFFSQTGARVLDAKKTEEKGRATKEVTVKGPENMLDACYILTGKMSL